MKKVIIDTLKKYKWVLMTIVIFVSINMYLATYPSKIVGWIIDLFYNIEKNKLELIKNIAFLIVMSIFLLLVRLPWRSLVTFASRSFEKELKNKIFEQFLKIKLTNIQNIKNGEIMSYFTKDVTEIRAFFFRIISFGTRIVATTIIVTYTMMKGVNIKLTLMTLCPIVITSFIVIKIKRYVEISFKKSQKNFTVLSEYVQECTDAIRTTKSYSAEAYQLKDFIRKNKILRGSNISVETYSGLLTMCIKICFGLCYSISLIYGSKLVLEGDISIGDFTAFNGYIGLFVLPVETLPGLISRFKRAQISYDRLNNLFKLEKEKILVLENEKENLISGNIKINNLSFNYPATIEVVLKNINLTIKQGTTLGIIGTIGSGKTTLSSILLKLYSIPNGKIEIGGKDINQIPLTDLRRSFCYITQDNFLFSTTLKENITLFKDNYSDSDIEDSLKSSKIYKEINEMKNGIDTVIGNGGADLSGGQKQRVALSRAFIKRSNYIIFDDTFSALDNKTERQVLKNVKKLCKDKTCIIISNRISDIKDADNIIVLDNGLILEQGTHEQLLNNNNLYTKFYHQQVSQKN